MAEGSAWLSNCETTWCLSVCSTLVMYSSQQFKAKCHLGRELCLFVRWDSQFHRESVGRRSLLLCRCEAGVIKMFCFQRYWATDSCESELLFVCQQYIQLVSGKRQPQGPKTEANTEVPNTTLPLMATRGWLLEWVNPQMIKCTTLHVYSLTLKSFWPLWIFPLCNSCVEGDFSLKKKRVIHLDTVNA